MINAISADVCVVGAGPVGGTLACALASAGLSTVLVDRAALLPMEHRRLMAVPMRSLPAPARLLQQAGFVGDASGSAQSDPGHSRDRRLGWPAPIAAAPAISIIAMQATRRLAGWWRPAACGAR